ncbi:MAG: FAD-dependent oxidoreductase [Qipengyuania pacifica]
MEYDLVIIGTGTAAMVCAMRVAKAGWRVAKAGWRVAVVDEKPFGGTCALRGCDPKKMLVAGAEAIDAKQRMTGHGVEGDVRIDWLDLIRFKRSFTDPVPDKHQRRYEEAGIATLHGTATFMGPNRLSVGDEEIRYRKILIASGARPIPLDIPGEEHLIDNEGFLELPSLPKRIILVGGGYIAAEFSHIAARAGAEVTIIQRGPRMLTQFEPELVSWLMDAFDRIGVRVITYTAVDAIRKRGGEYVVHASGPIEVAADLVVHAAGRVPAIERLNVKKADVAVENRKLKLSEFCKA